VNNLMIFAAIDFVSLLPFALFGAIAIGAWVLIDIVFNSKTKTESRLEQMKNRAQGKSEVLKESGGAKEGITKLLESASPKLSEALKPKSEKEINSLRQKLNEAGFRSENAPALLSTLKVLAGGFGFIFGGGIALFTSGVNMWTLLYSLGAGVLFCLCQK
jgi:tight adherence protein C